MNSRCVDCERDFNSEESLQQHQIDKHNMNAGPSKKEIREAKLEEKKIEKESKFKERENKQKIKTYVKIGIIIIPLLFIGFHLMTSDDDTGNVTANDYVSFTEDDPFLGDEDAPVTIIEYSDFECPFCTRFYFQTEKQIIDQYVNTGKVKFVYKNFPVPISHPNAQIAAEAAECAYDQDKFWEYHDLLFENNYQGDAYSNKGSRAVRELFLKYARDVDLDEEQFSSCFSSGVKRDIVRGDLEDAQKAGVRGTPSFIINGKLVVGAQPFSKFSQLIEAELVKLQV